MYTPMWGMNHALRSAGMRVPKLIFASVITVNTMVTTPTANHQPQCAFHCLVICQHAPIVSSTIPTHTNPIHGSRTTFSTLYSPCKGS